MKIAFAHHLKLSYMGGGEKWIIETAKEFQKRGHEVSVYCLPFSLEKDRKFKVEDLDYHEGFFHSIKADVCYLTYNPLNWLNYKISKPRIAGIHSFAYWSDPNFRYGLLPTVANIANKFTSYFELRRFNAVHTVNKAFYPNHPNVFVVPDYVDSNTFKPYAKDDDFSIIYNSRKVWQKGWDTFKDIESNFNWFGKVKTSGKIPERELPQFISSGHVMVNPSIVDTFGMSIVESMMCETPVVASPIPAHLGLELPLLYASSTKEYLKNIKSLYIMHQEGTLKRLGKDCRRASMKYDKKVVVDKLENMFEEVLDASTRN